MLGLRIASTLNLVYYHDLMKRIKNEIIPGTEGGITKFFDSNENQMSIYDAANKYKKNNYGRR